jgi:DNA-binding CsgD family transcriptional regulator
MTAVSTVLGREAELGAINGFLADPGSARALLLRGEPGIGKSTLWLACIALASERGYQIVSTRPTEAEAKFSYVGLGDLLEGLRAEFLDDLPGPQRVALNATLLRADAPSEGLDHRTICVAVLASLRTIAAFAPLLIAIDDVQWLDGPTALVLQFIARRLTDEPIRFIAALRAAAGVSDPVDLARTLGEGHVRTIDLKGLSCDSLNMLFQERLDATFPRPTLNRLFEVSGGNAFLALEIARALIAGRLQLEPGRMVSMPPDLADLVRVRLAELPPSIQELLLMCSAASAPTTELLRSAAADRDRVSSELATAVRAGVIDLEGGRIRFTHPLLSSAVYSEATEDRRREVHRRLAAAVADPEEHAWHLALAADGPASNIAAELEDAARLARQRGAPGAAADLCTLAADLTPMENASDIRRLRLQAADGLLLAGDPERALDIAGSVVETAPPGPERAEALLRKGAASLSLYDYERAADQFGDALLQAGVGPDRLSALHTWRAWALWPHDLHDAERHAVEAVRLAERSRDPTLLADALCTLIAVRTFLGSIVPPDLMARALELDEDMDPFMVFDRPGVILAIRHLLEGRLDEARSLLLQFRDEATAKGDEASTETISGRLGWLEDLAGNWNMFLDHHARSTALPDAAAWSLLRLARIQACMGETAHAAAKARKGFESSVRAGDLLSQIEALSVLGFIDLSSGDPIRAHEHLQATWEIQQRWGFGEPAWFRYVADHVEALIELGRREDAVRVLEWLEERGRALDRPWALAVAARYRGLLAAARGDIPSALDFLDDALKHHQRLPMPFELGRTLLVGGTIRRRAKQKRPAREALEQALEIFERLGAPLWAARARAELARVSGRRPVVGQLTPSERRVARLAAAGRTNQEIADALFTSTRTVGAHLSHIYAKLGIRSRTELALFLEPAQDPGGHS